MSQPDKKYIILLRRQDGKYPVQGTAPQVVHSGGECYKYCNTPIPQSVWNLNCVPNLYLSTDCYLDFRIFFDTLHLSPVFLVHQSKIY